MNVLMVHRQAARSRVVITCERCHTAWTPVNATAQELGFTVDRALQHVCDPERPPTAPVTYTEPERTD